MSLSLCVAAKDSGRYVGKLLEAGRSFADEVVVAVDSASTDDTYEVCRKYADKLFLLEPLATSGYLGPGLTWLHDQCTGDWILRLDHDELPSTKLVEALPRLMEDREVTHYWLRRRWVVSGGRWVPEHPWWPDWQLRMFRNIRSLVRVERGPHKGTVVAGGCRYHREGAIYHLDFVYHGEQHRRRKVELFESLAPGGSLGHFYLPDDESVLKTLPIPTEDGPLEGRSRRIEWRRFFREHTRPGRLKRRKPVVEPNRKITVPEIRQAAMQEYEYGPKLFRARLEYIDCPTVMRARQWYPIDLDLTNESTSAWPLAGLGVPEVRLGYHWLRHDGEVYEFNGHRTDLPHTLRPGETTSLAASVLAPGDPGRYILQWDLVIENVSWFSWQGWSGPEIDVQVVDASDTSTLSDY